MNDTSADLRSLLDRLKGAQHALIEDAARQPGLPSTAIIRKIAELENVIAAVMALIEERRQPVIRLPRGPVCCGPKSAIAPHVYFAQRKPLNPQSPAICAEIIGHCCGNRVYRSVQPRAHAGP